MGNNTAGGEMTVWASGSKGVILRSTDAGKNWTRLHVAQGKSLDFRGVQAFDENNAYLMSSGEGGKSRIYRTRDGGKSWEMQYSDARKEFFLDAISCKSSTECFALSDPVDGKFLILHTEDGKHWKELPNAGMPQALAKEGAFAASNSSLLLYGEQEIYFATGGPAARVFHSADRGKSWTVTATPVLYGKSAAGIFSLARWGETVVVVGGDYEKPEQMERAAAYSLDQGKTWKLAEKGPAGYRSAVATHGAGFVAVGPNGEEMSPDGIQWMPVGEVNLNAVAFLAEAGWGVGGQGTVARFAEKAEK